MSTVGFVGEAPESTAGRLVSSVLMVSGFALVALVTASIASLFAREEELPDEVAERAFEARADAAYGAGAVPLPLPVHRQSVGASIA